TGRPSCSAIDISLASEGARYDWATQPDSWGSDHLPIIITPVGGKIRRTRQCTTIDWRAFRQRLREAPVDQDFLGLVAAAAQAATIQCRLPENHPVPDLRHLNLRAARARLREDGRVGRASATLSAGQEAAPGHGGFYGPSSSDQWRGNPSFRWPSAWASVSKNWQNGWPIASRYCQ
ncbi:hypothetical protein MTO96_047122, partial [Rhipicephalus appendiculatus]